MDIQIETGEECLFKLYDNNLNYVVKGTVYDYSETVSIAIIALHNSKNTDIVYLKPQFIDHTEKREPIDIKTEFNGYFDFTYIVLPTSKQESTSPTYYSENHKIYRVYNNETELITVLQLIEDCQNGADIANISDNLVSICNLKKEFRNLCEEIYKSRTLKSCSYKGCVNKELIKKRNLIWTFINLISYYTDLGEFFEAQRLIELIDSCYVSHQLDTLKCINNCININ